MAVSNSVSGSSTLKFDDVVSVILSEEMRRKSTGETSGDALTMNSRGIPRDRGKSSGNHGKSRKDRSKSRPKNLECWNCGKKGHLKRDCKAPQKQEDGQ